MKQTRIFRLIRQTKGALFYEERTTGNQESPTKGTPLEILTSVYMRKSALNGDTPPDTMAVTVEWE